MEYKKIAERILQKTKNNFKIEKNKNLDNYNKNYSLNNNYSNNKNKYIITILKNNLNNKIIKLKNLDLYNNENKIIIKNSIEGIYSFFSKNKLDKNHCIDTIFNYLYLINLFPNQNLDGILIVILKFLTSEKRFYYNNESEFFFKELFDIANKGDSNNIKNISIFKNKIENLYFNLMKFTIENNCFKYNNKILFLLNLSKYYFNEDIKIFEIIYNNIHKNLDTDNFEKNVLQDSLIEIRDNYLEEKKKLYFENFLRINFDILI